MNYDVVIVGGGIAGLTSAAYLSKEGYKVLLCEKQDEVGGLVSSFNVKGFTFDGGIRAIENSGIVFPMLRQLGIDIDFKRSTVSVGIDQEVINISSKESLVDYQNLLINQFPDLEKDIVNIIKEIKKIMKYLDILYGIDNPLFLDFKTNRKYFITTIFPWMFKYAFTVNKIVNLSMPVNDYLKKFTKSDELIDVIGQHFFKETPAFFALSYFSLYLDYRYPKGGTGKLVEAMREFIVSHGGEIQTETEITYVNPQTKLIKDSNKNEYSYQSMIWASDLRNLYKMIDLTDITDLKAKQKIELKQSQVDPLKGGDSIQAVYIASNLGPEYFDKLCTGHFFYTPLKKGLKDVMERQQSLDYKNKVQLFDWLKDYYKYTTYEIAIPGLRDDSLSPKGQTGLVVSTLMDYEITKAVAELGFYDDYKKLSEELMIESLSNSIFPKLKDSVIFKFSSSPLTIENRTNNSNGAITGWAFTNKTMPAVTSMPGIAKSVLTPIPDVFQAGQWSYSPSGLPISILTGKLASDKVKKNLKKV